MIFLTLLAIGMAGLFAHWLNKWARGRTKSGFIAYMRAHRKYTVASLISVFSSVVMMYLGGDIQELSNMVMASAFTAGFTIDNIVNKAPEEA